MYICVYIYIYIHMYIYIEPDIDIIFFVYLFYKRELGRSSPSGASLPSRPCAGRTTARPGAPSLGRGTVGVSKHHWFQSHYFGLLYLLCIDTWTTFLRSVMLQHRNRGGSSARQALFGISMSPQKLEVPRSIPNSGAVAIRTSQTGPRAFQERPVMKGGLHRTGVFLGAPLEFEPYAVCRLAVGESVLDDLPLLHRECRLFRPNSSGRGSGHGCET